MRIQIDDLVIDSNSAGKYIITQEWEECSKDERPQIILDKDKLLQLKKAIKMICDDDLTKSIKSLTGLINEGDATDV